MRGQPLTQVSSHEYLGVTVSDDLRPSNHITKVIGKARRTLGVVRRTLKACTPAVKERAYQALVRPKLEYASCAWNPHTDKDVKALEQIQREACPLRNRAVPMDNQCHWTPVRPGLEDPQPPGAHPLPGGSTPSSTWPSACLPEGADQYPAASVQLLH